MDTIKRTEQGLLVAPELLGTLGELVSAPKSLISPLRFGPPRPVDAALRRDLTAAKVLNTRGSLAPDARRTLEALAGAVSFARVIYAAGPSASETVFYFTPEAAAPISVSNTQEGLLITDPTDPAAWVSDLADLAGRSRLQTLGFETRLPPDAALVMAALVDLVRKAILRSIVTDEDVEIGAHTPEEIAAELARPFANTRWLATAVAETCQREPGLSVPAVRAALSDLVEKELVLSDDQRFILNVTPALLARRFLFFDQAFKLEAGQQALADGTPVMVGFTCLQAGVHDLLCLEYVQDQVHLETISSFVLLERLSFFVSTPDALTRAAAETAQAHLAAAAPLEPEAVAPPPLIAQTAAPTCPHCGSPITPGAKFCGGCGAPTQPAPVPPPAPPAAAATCSRCGSALTPGIKFCGNCGTKVA